MITSIRFRAAEDGKVILQVCEYTERDYEYIGARSKSEWRDAIVEDLMMVAAYVRAHDALMSEINTLSGEVGALRSQVNFIAQDQAREGVR